MKKVDTQIMQPLEEVAGATVLNAEVEARARRQLDTQSTKALFRNLPTQREHPIGQEDL